MVFLVKLKTIFHLSQPQYTLALVYYKMQVVLNLRAQSKSDKKNTNIHTQFALVSRVFRDAFRIDFSRNKKSWMIKRVYDATRNLYLTFWYRFADAQSTLFHVT